MVFSSLTFLFLFFPAVLLGYFLVPKSAKNALLFFFSLLFYAWGEPVYVVLMLFSTVVDYIHGMLVDKYRGQNLAKYALISSVVINLSLLCFFKYSDMMLGTINALFGTAIPLLSLPLPIGISFYTFQTMSYTIDVYRNEAKPQKNILSFGAYVALFPQLIAGPIVRYQTIADQLENRRETFDDFGYGVQRFVTGLAKKVLLANSVGALWDTISATNTQNLSVLGAWIGILAFAFQIYFDFSGYSDMAIGLGHMFGFTFLENFNYPYISKSITEFWRRWHISLGTWFKEYVYIPLGGNRGGKAQTIRNIFIVWLLTGIWHGASYNFLLWGLYYGVLLLLEKFVLHSFLQKLPAWAAHSYTLLLVLIGWVLFAFDDIYKALAYCGVLFGGGAFADKLALYSLLRFGLLFIFCVLGSTPAPKQLFLKLQSRLSPQWQSVLTCTGLGLILLFSVSYLVSSSYNPFLYFRF